MSQDVILVAPSPPPVASSKPDNASVFSGNVRLSQSEASAIKRKRDAGLAVPSSSPKAGPSSPGTGSQAGYSKAAQAATWPTMSHDPSSNQIIVIDDVEKDELETENGGEEGEEDDDDGETAYVLHIEVRLRPGSTVLYDTVRQSVGQYITDNFTSLETHAPVPDWEEIKFIADEVDSVCCAESAYPSPLVPLQGVTLHVHIYELPVEGQDKVSVLCANPQEMSDGALGSNTDDELVDGQEGDVAALRLELPAQRLEGIWESLVYEGGVKTRLLNYIYSSVVFAEQNVNQSLITWHRLLLLHGPPGTGKTSLCRALAQKISIRLSGIYQKTELVEINSHSLFSKWFSESGKLVQSLFTKIGQMADDLDVFVMVLIDEVESLAGSRSTGTSGNEPSDALRAVNALLTELDKLKHRRNILVLTTSNITGSIDNAFLDRADIKQYIGLPPPEAIYWILRTCLCELVKAGIVGSRNLLDYKEALMARGDPDEPIQRPENEGGIPKKKRTSAERSITCSTKLLNIAEQAKGMSGRTLRRLPLLAHALTAVLRSGSKPTMETYLDGMLAAVEHDKSCTTKLEGNAM